MWFLRAIVWPIRMFVRATAWVARHVWKLVRHHLWAVLGVVALAVLVAGDVLVAVPKTIVVGPAGSLPPPDTWLDIVLGLGAIATGAGVAGGGFLAWRYGRRASVSVSATVQATSDGYVLAIRPVVRAIGIFPVRFQKLTGAVITIWNMYVDDSGLLVPLGEPYEMPDVYEKQFADAAEELATTVLWHPRKPTDRRVVGWSVVIVIEAQPRWLREKGSWWTDRTYVPRPLPVQGARLW
jgi:hypothetical protein